MEHLPFIQQFVREGRLSNANIEPPDLKLGEARAWKSIELVLGTASALLSDQRFPPVRRLVHALQFANLLDKAETKKMDDQKLAELVRVLSEVVPEESKPFFAERRPPSAFANVLFRSMAIEFSRLHPRFIAMPSWSQRLELANCMDCVCEYSRPAATWSDWSCGTHVNATEPIDRNYLMDRNYLSSFSTSF